MMRPLFGAPKVSPLLCLQPSWIGATCIIRSSGHDYITRLKSAPILSGVWLGVDLRTYTKNTEFWKRLDYVFITY